MDSAAELQFLELLDSYQGGTVAVFIDDAGRNILTGQLVDLEQLSGAYDEVLCVEVTFACGTRSEPAQRAPEPAPIPPPEQNTVLSIMDKTEPEPEPAQAPRAYNSPRAAGMRIAAQRPARASYSVSNRFTRSYTKE